MLAWAGVSARVRACVRVCVCVCVFVCACLLRIVSRNKIFRFKNAFIINIINYYYFSFFNLFVGFNEVFVQSCASKAIH